MPLGFNTLLRDAGIDPSAVRLLRHETRNYSRTPYAVWRDDPKAFNDYQRIQKADRRAYFNSPYWASFVVTPTGKTLFAGLFEVKLTGQLPDGWVDPISGKQGDELAGYEIFDLTAADALRGYNGRLYIIWGAATRSWVQRADSQDKEIIEINDFIEPPFPGFMSFLAQLSDLANLPSSWNAALSNAKGVYLLTCPKTYEQYVGSATGESGFAGRWRDYWLGGDGGNVALRKREPSNYRVSILQVAGSQDDPKSILAMEKLWKEKLQSREMGLNRN